MYGSFVRDPFSRGPAPIFAGETDYQKIWFHPLSQTYILAHPFVSLLRVSIIFSMPFRRRQKKRRPRRRHMVSRRRRRIAIDPEWKFVDQSTDGGSAALFLAAPLILLLNGIDTGSNQNQREGRQAKFLSFTARFRTILAATVAEYQLRFFLVLDHQSNGGAFALGSLIQNSTTTPLIGLRNLNNNKRFVILKTWMITGSNASVAEKVKAVHVPLNFLTRYNGNGATEANIATNSLLLVVVTNQPDTDNRVNLEFSTRIRFVG